MTTTPDWNQISMIALIRQNMEEKRQASTPPQWVRAGEEPEETITRVLNEKEAVAREKLTLCLQMEKADDEGRFSEADEMEKEHKRLLEVFESYPSLSEMERFFGMSN